MPAIMSSKFMHAQRFLREWRAIAFNPITTKVEKAKLRADVIRRAEKIGLGTQGFSQWLNKARIATVHVKIEKRILNQKSRTVNKLVLYDKISSSN